MPKKKPHFLLSWSLAMAGIVTAWFSEQKESEKISVPPESKAAGHELREANARGLMWFGLSMIIGAVVMHLSLAGLFFHWRHPEQLLKRPLPPEPRLQTNPRQDFQGYLRKETELLSTYGWIDRKNQIVRIPIDRAIDLLVEKTGGSHHE